MDGKTQRISKEDIALQYKYMSLVREKNKDKNLYFHVMTFGCQQNEADSERIKGMAAEMGYKETDKPENADLVVVNTCAVREHAELRALSITGQLKHLKAKKPDLKIGICGCMVTQLHRKEDIKHRYPYVDFLFGTDMLWCFPEILYNSFKQKKRLFYFSQSEGNLAEDLPVKRDSTFKAWVSIMYGCNNFCSYCIVPYVRGRERSRYPEDILREVKCLVEHGYKEITLLGQNVNSYGKDLEIDYDFSDLLTDVCKTEGEFWVRFMTSHPKDASRKLIDTMARENKIVKHLHLPLQSGDDRVLKVMNRHYTSESYLELVEYAKEKIPDLSLTSDIIVGFPGETEEEFENTLKVLEKVRYDSVYSFIYSPRKDTPASKMEQLPEEVKKERFQRLLDVQNAITKDINDCYDGKTVRVLVEGRSKNDPEKFTGRNEKNRLVHFDADDSYIGKFVDIRINHADTFAMYGEIEKNSR